MVKFLKTFFRSKRSLERSLYDVWCQLNFKRAHCEGLEKQLAHTRELNETLRKGNAAQSATIASLQRDLAAAHAKLLIQEETPPAALHEAGKRVRKKPVHLSYTERDEVLHYWRRGKSIQDIAKAYEITERTVHRIVKEAQGRDS